MNLDSTKDSQPVQLATELLRGNNRCLLTNGPIYPLVGCPNCEYLCSMTHLIDDPERLEKIPKPSYYRREPIIYDLYFCPGPCTTWSVRGNLPNVHVVTETKLRNRIGSLRGWPRSPAEFTVWKNSEPGLALAFEVALYWHRFPAPTTDDYVVYTQELKDSKRFGLLDGNLAGKQSGLSRTYILARQVDILGLTPKKVNLTWLGPGCCHPLTAEGYDRDTKIYATVCATCGSALDIHLKEESDSKAGLRIKGPSDLVLALQELDRNRSVLDEDELQLAEEENNRSFSEASLHEPLEELNFA